SVDGFWKRGLFVEFSFVFLASSWFFAGRAVAVWLGGGVPVFKEEDDTCIFLFLYRLVLALSQVVQLAVVSLFFKRMRLPRLLAASSLDRHACNFSASSFHGCPVILSAAGVKKVRGAVAETPLLQQLSRAADSHDIRDQLMRDGYINELQMSESSDEVVDSIEIMRRVGCGFADEVGNLVSHPNLQLWVEVIEVFKTHVGLCVIIESSIEVVNLKKTEPEL
ncbi:hypothetical protein Tco_0741322, partial [Tanacetum coccineum]